jgi:hypothetical protein
LFVPIFVGGEANGVISLQNLDRENAFSESDVSLLTTLTNAMSVALENARLFDETQRLLKITEERSQELVIINSVQAALAAELNIQCIYDADGDAVGFGQVLDLDKGVGHAKFPTVFFGNGCHTGENSAFGGLHWTTRIFVFPCKYPTGTLSAKSVSDYFCGYSMDFKNCPVYDSLTFATSSGVPSARS